MNLSYLNFSNYVMRGDIPSSISHLSKLESLDLGNSDTVTNDPSYLRMRLDPFTWKKLIHNATNLREIGLDGVDISSLREKSLSVLTNLYGLPKTNWSSPFMVLDLSFTAFSGDIPHSIGHLKSLISLDLHFAILLDYFPHHCHLDLSNNHFTGSISEFSPYFLVTLLLSNNKLEALEVLDLGNNNFEDTFPYWLETANITVDGRIPMTLTTLNFLAILNLSQNHFEGGIPTEWESHSTIGHKESGFGWKAVAVGYACGVLFGIILGCNVFFAGKPKWLARLIEGVIYKS
ncbi:hypothetical protein VNO78_33326 [Psophocarpus tetragonolobus]|uniref:Uncharacterized protein n=1 Tax=Psophocarpus tetragonolobus TaxID=3891 RepID=A0AAN9RQM6_PSOTE